MRSSKKSANNFIVQGSILAIASIIAKVIGLIYRVPLTNILGDSGNSYYSTANEIYMNILMISSFSLPLAVSRMISERIHRGEFRNANKVFLCAMRLAVIAGVIMSLLTYFLARVFTKYVMKVELAQYGLRVIAPAILIFAITGTFRGFFQGFESMIPTAVSQLLEQVINAVMTIVGALLMFQYGLKIAAETGNPEMGPAWGAAGATFGTVASVSVAMIFMMVVYTMNWRGFSRQVRQDTSSKKESSARIYRILIITISPIILSSLINNISSVVDQGIFNSSLKRIGYEESQYAVIWGIYVGKFRVLLNVALSLASSIGPAIVPSMTASIASRDKKEAMKKATSAVRFTMLFSIPCAFGLAAMGGPVVEMLFHPKTGIPLTVGIMKMGGVLVILYAYSTLTTSILQGMGKLREPLIHSTVALIIHIIGLEVLLRVFNLNIYAVILAEAIFALLVSVMNLLTLQRALGFRQELYRTFFIPMVASAIMAFGAYGVYSLFHMIFGVTISTLAGILAGVVIYVVGMIAFRGITLQEIASLPKGTTIIRLCRKFGLIR